MYSLLVEKHGSRANAVDCTSRDAASSHLCTSSLQVALLNQRRAVSENARPLLASPCVSTVSNYMFRWRSVELSSKFLT